MNSRIQKVTFATQELREAYQNLKSGKFEDKVLAFHIQTAMGKLQSNPLYGVIIPKKLWPNTYLIKFQINNLRKCNLPDGWRLVYTLRGNKIEIVSVLLEWFNHHEYEKRFGYRHS
ncbi:MAG TPA: hypothetical protein VNF06_03065 [Candidatus Aquilonibacter sp.]|nr:hypothetical protein [Candidatus Aquilonibacter sp.]